MSRRHAQKGKADTFVCTKCKAGECNGCIDILRSLYSERLICHCKAAGHSGEPNEKQILDPETGTVHAPGLTVSIDGEVTRR